MSKKQVSLIVLISRIAVITSIGAATIILVAPGTRAAGPDFFSTIGGYLGVSSAVSAADPVDPAQQDGTRAIYRGVTTAARFDV
jgi:hypothetical protein